MIIQLTLPTGKLTDDGPSAVKFKLRESRESLRLVLCWMDQMISRCWCKSRRTIRVTGQSSRPYILTACGGLQLAIGAPLMVQRTLSCNHRCTTLRFCESQLSKCH